MYNNNMEHNQLTKILINHRTEILERSIRSLYVFGSVARNQATVESDIDLLVEFDKPVGIFEFIRVKDFLEKITQCKINLVTEDALHPELKQTILNEAIHVC